MIIEKLRRDYYFSVFTFILVELLLILAFLFVAIAYEGMFSQGLIVLSIGTLGFWIVTVYKIKDRYKKFMNHQKFRVVTLENKINYPTYFKKSMVVPLFLIGKGYMCKKTVIPKTFISFIEGKLVYPIKELEELGEKNHYEILYIYKGYAALIQDESKKRYLIHMDNLEPI
ncbi:MAG: hypothetical protein A2Y45_07635 [Tenericutes bacterium GWC2_34_14]|nr:MAG: hypothetical protein A2Y45_07635 [Tenericutes bacterium GWC2_34_14]OHE34750.1 MAG: hypothetical protein A2012_01245 [Tenericutes bacterium GWE2_34_108]OHE37389.1 MAG: hypothetical protein A2Y46_01765 [Tenericutes bacterium GWF1_35_14]OHE39478.1 MAG: hypothetical protein A2Y44_01095 [Tenericutes bacterium GWF2_35_184]OHE42561.1 MAG: hypothetical protein A3K26_04195 [Tenericutes bacterium RIFOXYA12_FULL_35_10]OHE44333.1 MAG: hypothetical protein A2221_04415 [Tenericutes bacterium RIFOXYA